MLRIPYSEYLCGHCRIMHDVRECVFFIVLCEHVHKHDTFNLLALHIK